MIPAKEIILASIATRKDLDRLGLEGSAWWWEAVRLIRANDPALRDVDPTIVQDTLRGWMVDVAEYRLRAAEYDEGEQRAARASVKRLALAAAYGPPPSDI
jgi:hypothetical protein